MKRYMNPFSCILLCCIFLLSSIYIAKAEVITLTGDTFNDKCHTRVGMTWVWDPYPIWSTSIGYFDQIRGRNFGQIHDICNQNKDYNVAEDDPHPPPLPCIGSSVLLILKPFFSKNLGTLWDDLGKTMEGEDEIEVGQVDCGTDKPVCNKVDIHSYPTFKLFYNGEEVAKYQGPRDIESLKVFALEEAEKAATKAEADDDKEL
uniref:Thioredoxin domain 2; Thioredoxin fold n=1 Tax=Solanum tuberosum TaxID=4113 RepID=M1BQN1_SOLTU